MLMLGLGVGMLARRGPHVPSVVGLCYFYSFDKGSHAFPLSPGANVKAETIGKEAEGMVSSGLTSGSILCLCSWETTPLQC